MTIFQALSISMAIKAGEAKVVGRVEYYPTQYPTLTDPKAVSMIWQPLTATSKAELMHKYEKRLEDALEARLRRMEAANVADMTEEEYNSHCERYGRYKRLLEAKRGIPSWALYSDS